MISFSVLPYIIFHNGNKVLVQHMTKFKRQAKKVNWHIESDFTEEMASKSVAVS